MFVFVCLCSIRSSLHWNHVHAKNTLGFTFLASRWINSSPESFIPAIVKSSNSTDSSIHWINRWNSIEELSIPCNEDLPIVIPDEKRIKSSAIERIVLRLQNITIDGEDDEIQFHPSGGHDSTTKNDGFDDFLQRNWVRPDKIYHPSKIAVFVANQSGNSSIRSRNGRKKRTSAPFLAELALGADELQRFKRLGKTLTDIITVPKAGLTHTVMDKIHDRWKNEELVTLKFHEDLTNKMKMAKRLVESRTRGWVVRLSGAFMTVFRGRKTEEISSENTNSGTNSSPTPSISSTSLTPLDVNMSKSRTKSEHDRILDGLGPRFTEWWGTSVLPVDADLLPSTIPDYMPPFRVLPIGKRSSLSDKELQNLRKLSKTMPSHFALGRNRHHHGLAAAIVKLWERSFIAKISVKQGVQNTNNKLMAEELKHLTGGTLLLRNKYYIILYRGNDFVPATVASNLLKKTHKNEESGKVSKCRVKKSRKKQRKKLIQEDNNVVSSMADEELRVLRRMGMVMRVYYHIKKMGDIFVASRNMHKCWKYREVVKVTFSKNGYSCVEEMGRRLEHVSGGILVAIGPSPKGYSLIYYRGRKYCRPKSNRFTFSAKRRQPWHML